MIVLEFFLKWLDEGRFPREELRIRWAIAALGALVMLVLTGALIVAWLA